MSVTHVHGVDNYNESKKNTGLVVVDFSAEWCGPCKMIAPYFEQLAGEFPSVAFLHVDVDDQELLKHDDLQDVRGVPTFKFYVNGELKDQFSGASKDKLKEYVEKYSVLQSEAV